MVARLLPLQLFLSLHSLAHTHVLSHIFLSNISLLYRHFMVNMEGPIALKHGMNCGAIHASICLVVGYCHKWQYPNTSPRAATILAKVFFPWAENLDKSRFLSSLYAVSHCGSSFMTSSINNIFSLNFVIKCGNSSRILDPDIFLQLKWLQIPVQSLVFRYSSTTLSKWVLRDNELFFANQINLIPWPPLVHIGLNNDRLKWKGYSPFDPNGKCTYSNSIDFSSTR